MPSDDEYQGAGDGLPYDLRGERSPESPPAKYYRTTGPVTVIYTQEARPVAQPYPGWYTPEAGARDYPRGDTGPARGDRRDSGQGTPGSQVATSPAGDDTCLE